MLMTSAPECFVCLQYKLLFIIIDVLSYIDRCLSHTFKHLVDSAKLEMNLKS